MRAAIRLRAARDRKSTRLNSSHLVISYAVFCLKKKKITASIPNNLLNNTNYVIVITSILKFAIGVGGYFGRGAITCRTGEHFTGHFFFFNDTATTEIYTLSLHDALPI